MANFKVFTDKQGKNYMLKSIDPVQEKACTVYLELKGSMIVKTILYIPVSQLISIYLNKIKINIKLQ